MNVHSAGGATLARDAAFESGTTAAVSQRSIWIDLLLYPGHTLPTAAAPVVVGVGLAIHDHTFAPAAVLGAFVCSWLVHVGGVFTDNYELLRRHPQIREHPELLDALRDGKLTYAALRFAIAVCFGGALLIGLYLVPIVGLPVVALLGAVGIASSVLYAAGPVPYARQGIADIVFFLMFACVAVPAAYYVQAAGAHAGSGRWFVSSALPLDAFIIGLPIGALVTNVLLIDDIRDREFDRAKGWRTGAVRHGLRWNRTEITVLTSFAYACPLWFWIFLGFSPWTLLALLTLPEAYAIARKVTQTDRFQDLFPMTPRASRLVLDYAVLLAIGLAAQS